MEIPVYVFTGFLESGKTTIMQQSLEDKEFNAGERTLLLLCEEGEEEYDESRFPAPNVFIRTIEREDELTADNLQRLLEVANAERVMIEYNGMWAMESLYMAFPDNWVLYQEIMIVDAGTFVNYNDNMRSLVFDKLSTCDLVAFNRVTPLMDRMTFHKIVRGVSPRVDIIYEDLDGKVEYDEIVDPLPFDVEAPVIEIEDDDYGLWYRDLMEETDKYRGKVVQFKGIVAVNEEKSKEDFAVGRQVMTCCVEDIAYAGVMCIAPNRREYGVKNNDWVIIEGEIDIQYHPVYKAEGPVLIPHSVQKASAPDEEVATLY